MINFNKQHYIDQTKRLKSTKYKQKPYKDRWGVTGSPSWQHDRVCRQDARQPRLSGPAEGEDFFGFLFNSPNLSPKLNPNPKTRLGILNPKP